MVKRVWTIVVVGMILASSSGIQGCKAIKPQEVERVKPELRFEGLRYHVYRGSLLKATGQAERAALRRDTSDITVERMMGYFPGSEAVSARAEAGAGRAGITVKSARGEGNLRNRDAVARGGVQLESARKQVVETEEARYGPDGKIKGNRSIVARGENYMLTGPGFSLDPETEKIVIQGGATLSTGSLQGAP